MSLYQCEECGCVENTSCGHYHCRDSKEMWAPEFVGRKLCSACAPTHFKSGEPVRRRDEKEGWHGRFERHFYPKGSLYTDDQGNVRNKVTKDYPKKEDRILQ